MPRNRMIKHDFWADEKIGLLSSDTKLLFIGMWNFADDIGVLRSNYAYLKANIFPYDEKTTVKKIKEMSEILVKNNFLMYAEFNKEHYFLIKNFLKHQSINKPSVFRYVNDSTKHNVLELFTSCSSKVVVTHQSRMKEKEKEQEKETETEIIFDFGLVYDLYPRKQGKQNGLKKCLKEIKTQEKYDNLLKAVKNYKLETDQNNTEQKYIKQFSTFMGCWEDYVETELSIQENEYQKMSNYLKDITEKTKGINYFEGMLNG